MERRHKMCKRYWSVKYRSPEGTCRQYIMEKHYMVVVGLTVEDLSNMNLKCVKYRSRSPGQGTCQASTMRWSTMQGLGVVGDIEYQRKMCQSH